MNTISFSANSNIKPTTVQKHNSTVASSYTPISQEKEEKRQAKFGVAIAASTIGVGLGVLALGKGFSKSGRVKIDELYNALKLKSKKLSKTKPSTNSDKFTKVAVEKGKSVLESSRAVMNTISLKDILFKKITNPIPGVGKACQAITDFFENVAVQTTLASYKKTGKKFDKMFSAFNKANQSLDAKDVKKVSSSVETIKKTFNKTFSTGESLKRIQDSADTFKTLDNDFWNKSFKDVKNMAKDKDLYSSFIAEQMVAGDKANALTKLNKSKAAIQYSFKDDYNNLKNLADDIKGLLDPFKKENQELLENIKNNLNTYNKKHSAVAKQAVIDDMKSLTKHIDDKKVAEQFVHSIDNLPKNSDGLLQKTLKMYEDKLSPKEFNKLEKTVNKAMDSLEKSTILETDNLFDKRRDLKLGSAPTDMLTLLATFGTVGVGLGCAKNRDERESAALKYGIPAIGTVLASMYGNIKMYTAFKSLVFGAVSGLVINKIGEGADELRKQLKGEKKNNNFLVEMPTKKDVTDAIMYNTPIISDVRYLADGFTYVYDAAGNIILTKSPKKTV